MFSVFSIPYQTFRFGSHLIFNHTQREHPPHHSITMCSSGRTCLHLAATRGYTRCVSVLLECDASPALEVSDEAGLTPLKAALLSNNPQTSQSQHVIRLMEAKKISIAARSAPWERLLNRVSGTAGEDTPSDAAPCLPCSTDQVAETIPFVRSRSRSFGP